LKRLAALLKSQPNEKRICGGVLSASPHILFFGFWLFWHKGRLKPSVAQHRFTVLNKGLKPLVTQDRFTILKYL
jgi:hypothetical protein